MGMSSTPAAPPAPDPVATAAAQAAMNTKTATTQQQLNMVNQTNPEGSLNYTQSGTWADGTPKYSATTALSPVNQGIYDTNKQTEGNIANIGRDQSARIGDLLGTPLKLGNDATEARLMDLGTRRLNPQFAMDSEALRTRLANSGIKEGSAAYDAAQHNLDYSHNDAINQLLLTGRGQANQEMLTERNQPINEITALMSGSQVSNPTFANTPQAQVGGVDYMGAVNNNYNAQVQQQKIAQDANNAQMGGMFGLAGAGLGAAAKLAPFMMLSDRRAKTDIRKVGKLDNGLPVYVFRYKGDDTPQIGLMAQDVELMHPDAVHECSDGFLRVDYAQAVRA